MSIIKITVSSSNTGGNTTCSCTHSTDTNICENFESYYLGKLGPQSACWTTWNGSEGGDEDVTVRSNGSDNYILLDWNGGYQDIVLQLGNRTIGVYDLEFLLFTFYGDKAYYNILHNFSTRGNNEWASNMYFDGTGSGALEYLGNQYPFSYQTGKWIKVRQRIDLNNDRTSLYIDDTYVASWRYSYKATTNAVGLKKLSAINFYPINDSYRFFIDDVRLTTLANFDDTTNEMETAAFSAITKVAVPKLALFPNPTDKHLNIDLKGFNGAIEVRLVNMSGQIVSQFHATKDDVFRINVSTFSEGLYLVQTIDKNGQTMTKKVLIH